MAPVSVPIPVWFRGAFMVYDAYEAFMVLPPPQRRQRARSFPVPRGRTATGGRTWRSALSEITGTSFSLRDLLSQSAHWNTRATCSTYSIQEPPDCAVSSARQDPVFTQTAEEVQPERQSQKWMWRKVDRQTVSPMSAKVYGTLVRDLRWIGCTPDVG